MHSLQDAVVTITGHRKLPLATSTKNLSVLVRRSMEQARVALWPGSLKFNIGGALGSDLVAMFHSHEMGIPFDVYLPFPMSIFAAKWEPHMVTNAEKLLAHASKVIVLGEAFDAAGYQERNMAMVDNSGFVFAFWDGRKTGGTYNCLNYALRLRRPVFNGLDPLKPIKMADLKR